MHQTQHQQQLLHRGQQEVEEALAPEMAWHPELLHHGPEEARQRQRRLRLPHRGQEEVNVAWGAENNRNRPKTQLPHRSQDDVEVARCPEFRQPKTQLSMQQGSLAEAAAAP